MNIIHTESSCGWGGQEIRILEESRGLIQRGHNVQLLCPQESQIFESASKYGVPAHSLPIARKNFSGLFSIRHWIIENPVDIINTHSSTDSWLTAIACNTIFNAPPIIRTRHLSTTVHRNLPTWWLYRFANKHLVVTGEALKKQLINNNGLPEEQITSVPTGIDTERFQPQDQRLCRRELGLDQDITFIGILATLRDWKGHTVLFDAFKKLHQKYPSLKLLIVGDGPYRDRLDSYLDKLKISDLVLFVGHQENPEVWLGAMDIFTLPSWGDEGVSQALMQAMATGLPVITTPIGGLTEAVIDESTGLLVPPRDSNALASAIDRLLNDTNLATHLGNTAINHIHTYFGRDIMLDRMESIFKRFSKGN